MLKRHTEKTDKKKKNFLKYICKNEKGTTLLELTAVIVILGIILAVAVPIFPGIIENSRIAVDQATLATLNNATTYFRLTTLEEDPFINDTIKSEDLLIKLVDKGHLSSVVQPQSKDAKFQWLFDKEKWHLMFEDSFYVITLTDGFNLTDYGRLDGNYNVTSKDIIIPGSINGIMIKSIYQDAFRNKGLISVGFGVDSTVNQIHARAFQNNKLINIDLPSTLSKIDTYSFENNNLTNIELPSSLTEINSHDFKNNNLTEIVFPNSLAKVGSYAFEKNDIEKITIGEGVVIGNSVFGTNTKDFSTAYESGKAGTYILIGENWIRQ